MVLKGLREKELSRSAKKLKVMRPVCENFLQVAKASRNRQIIVQNVQGFNIQTSLSSPRVTFPECVGNVENISQEISCSIPENGLVAGGPTAWNVADRRMQPRETLSESMLNRNSEDN